jgi:hypothetical protein
MAQDSANCRTSPRPQPPCPVTVDLPFCQWILLVRHVSPRKLLGSDPVSSYSAAPEALDLDLQTSNHQVHRRSHSATNRTAELAAEQDPLANSPDFPARASPDPSPVRHSKFLTAGQALTPRKIICHRTPPHVGPTGFSDVCQRLRRSLQLKPACWPRAASSPRQSAAAPTRLRSVRRLSMILGIPLADNGKKWARFTCVRQVQVIPRPGAGDEQ